VVAVVVDQITVVVVVVVDSSIQILLQVQQQFQSLWVQAAQVLSTATQPMR
jgi:hypothetical protein